MLFGFAFIFRQFMGLPFKVKQNFQNTPISTPTADVRVQGIKDPVPVHIHSKDGVCIRLRVGMLTIIPIKYQCVTFTFPVNKAQ